MNMSDFPSTIGSGSPSSGAATASSTSNTVWPRPAPASRTSPSSSSNKQRGPSSEADGLVKSHQRGPSLKAGRISHTPSPPQPLHPLKHDWNISCCHRSSNRVASEADWEQSIKRLSSFGSVESFWNVWSHLKRPSQLPPITDIYIFKSHIAPKWEDANNVQGGKFVLRLKKGMADRIFENVCPRSPSVQVVAAGAEPFEQLVLAMIGLQLEPDDSLDTDEEEICGCVMSVRTSEDIISVWNRNTDRRDALRRQLLSKNADLMLPIGERSGLSYKAHGDNFKVHHGGSGGGGGGGGATGTPKGGRGSGKGGGHHHHQGPREAHPGNKSVDGDVSLGSLSLGA